MRLSDDEDATFTAGARVRYVGRSIMVVERGERGTVIGEDVRPGRRLPDLAVPQPVMIEVAWDMGGSNYCWPAELEEL